MIETQCKTDVRATSDVRDRRPLAASLQRSGPGARRRNGAEHSGDDGGTLPQERRRDDRDPHSVTAGWNPTRRRIDAQRARDRPRASHSRRRGRPYARALAGSHAARRRTAHAARVPYLVAAHGMAEPWALRHKRWKKRVYLALVEAKNLRRASCLHALSRPEIGHLRKHRSLDADLLCSQRRRSHAF